MPRTLIVLLLVLAAFCSGCVLFEPLNKPVPGATMTASGLQYIDLVVGNGAAPEPGKRITVHYTGTLEDGKKFDSSRDRGIPFSFVLGRKKVIAGWEEGVPGMRVGGQRKLIVPPELAYGERGAGNVIPPYATLIFDIELLDVQQ